MANKLHHKNDEVAGLSSDHITSAEDDSFGHTAQMQIIVHCMAAYLGDCLYRTIVPIAYLQF